MCRINNISNFKNYIEERIDKAIEKKLEIEKVENKLKEIDEEYNEYLYLNNNSKSIFNADIKKIHNIYSFSNLSNDLSNKDCNNYSRDELVKIVNDTCDQLIKNEFEYVKDYFELVDDKNRTYITEEQYSGLSAYSWKKVSKISKEDVEAVYYKILGILGECEEIESLKGSICWNRFITVNDRIKIKFEKESRLDIEFLRESDKEIIRDIFK